MADRRNVSAGTGPGGGHENALLARIGLPTALFWGFVGTLVFMIGDGVESAYLSPFLVRRGLVEHDVAVLVTVYGVAAAISSWLSGALADVIGPRRVMMAGLAIWVVFQVLFLAIAIPSHSYGLMLLFYGLRGFGYPLFAFGFLVWIVITVHPNRLGSAVGWFWFAFTGGLPTLGSILARVSIPLIGSYSTLWLALGVVIAGGLVALLGVRDPSGSERRADAGEHPVRALFSSLAIVRAHPKVGIGCIVRAVNTAAEFGLLVMLPIYFTKVLHFTLSQWLEVTACIFTSNIIGNLLSGIVSDWLTWRRTVMLIGGLGCTVSTLLLYWVPTHYGPRRHAAHVGGGRVLRADAGRIRAAVGADAVSCAGGQTGGDVDAQPRRRRQCLDRPCSRCPVPVQGRRVRSDGDLCRNVSGERGPGLVPHASGRCAKATRRRPRGGGGGRGTLTRDRPGSKSPY